MGCSENCISWNCCDDNLKECIRRSNYVKRTRSFLKEKKFEKNLEVRTLLKQPI